MFDYFGKGLLPEDLYKDIYVLASHGHQDHFSMKVFELFGENPKACFVLSYDIKKKYLKEIQASYPESLDRITFMMPNQSIKVKDMLIQTIGSTDLGVAYLINFDGKTFFHSGDLHLWIWKEETKEYNNKMENRYKKEIHKLKGKRIDYAFYPVDIRQEEYFNLGLSYFLEHTDTLVVFPMHYFGDYSIKQKLLDSPLMKQYVKKIVSIGNENQKFNFEEEK